jgi:hypothetical protein
MKWRLILFVVVGSTLCIGQQHDEKTIDERDPVVSRFDISEMPAIQALIDLSRNQNAPLGIVVDGERLCRSKVSYSGSNVPLSSIVKSIAAQVPGYGWEQNPESHVIRVTPVSVPAATQQFLNVVDEQYGPINANLQTLAFTLWVHIRYVLYPNRGTAGSILASSTDPVFELEIKHATAQTILDRIAVLTRGTWVLRPLPPTLTNLGADLPFAIFSNIGQVGSNSEDLCFVKGEKSPAR